MATSTVSRYSRFTKYRWRMGGASIPFTTIMILFLCGIVLGGSGVYFFALNTDRWFKGDSNAFASDKTLASMGENDSQRVAYYPQKTLGRNPDDEELTGLFVAQYERLPVPGDMIVCFCAGSEHYHAFLKVQPMKKYNMQAWIELAPIRDIASTEATATPTITPTPEPTPTPTATPDK